MAQAQIETLFDYRDRLDWVKQLGWSDHKLRQVPVHRKQTDRQPFISLTELGPAGLTNLYIYKNEVSEDIWMALSNFIANLGPPSGFEQQDMEGTKVWESRKRREKSV